MILLTANQKGGVGKSTICANIATALALQSQDVLILDADRQNTASEWAAERKSSYPEHPSIPCVQAYGDIERTLNDLSNRYKHVIVDVSGRDSEEMRSAMMCADTVLIPFKPSQPDLATLPTMSKIIGFSRRYNHQLKACALLSIAPTNPAIREIQYARECILEYDELLILDTVICDRKIYRDSMADGLGVIESLGRAESEISARKEITDLVNEVFNNG